VLPAYASECGQNAAQPKPPFNLKMRKAEEGTMTTLLFTITISATYRGTQEIYSAQVIACNGEKLYHPAEALSISEAVENVVKQIQHQEHISASSK
jgi:hypothetical protein